MGRDSSKQNITFSEKVSNADNVGDTMLSSHKEARQRAIAAKKITPTSVDSHPAAARTSNASAKRKNTVTELVSSDDEASQGPRGKCRIPQIL